MYNKIIFFFSFPSMLLMILDEISVVVNIIIYH